jgi:hypothetical protein
MQSRGDSWRRASLSCPLRPFAIKRDAVIAHGRNIRRPRVQRIGAGSHSVIVGAIQRTRCLAPRRSGLGWTGDPIFVVPGSDARRSGDHLPVLQDGGPPTRASALWLRRPRCRAIFHRTRGVGRVEVSRSTPHRAGDEIRAQTAHSPKGCKAQCR